MQESPKPKGGVEMKKAAVLLLCLSLFVALTACSNRDSRSDDLSEQNSSMTESHDHGISNTETESDSDTEEAEDGESLQKRLIMTVEGQKIEITLYDTPAANSLYEMLPLELNFEDYNSTEKIAYLPEKLSTEGEPDSFDPDVGDVCLYAPWGNLSIFDKDFPLSNGLISLGRIESGMEILSGMNSDFAVTLEKAD